MSKAAIERNYDHLVIDKKGKRIDISGADPFGARTTTFDYYESLFSPNLTAIFLISFIPPFSPASPDIVKTLLYGLNLTFIASISDLFILSPGALVQFL